MLQIKLQKKEENLRLEIKKNNQINTQIIMIIEKRPRVNNFGSNLINKGFVFYSKHIS